MQRGPDAAGILLVEPEGRCLLLLRSDDGTWALPGGHVEEGDETPLLAALRELGEETGYEGDVEVERATLDARRARSGFVYWTFGGHVTERFSPLLNAEHTDFGWFSTSDLPSPLHPGVKRLFERLGVGRAA